ncbi:MAG: HEAT repeat domain-containing protein [bacterium]|nr:HEAT repeat domain-containing protein [bacterium]
MKLTLIVALLGLALPTTRTYVADLNDYEWSAVAPTIVAGESLGAEGKFQKIRVQRVFRGDVSVESNLRLDLKVTNRARNREADPRPLRFEPDTVYILLLEPSPTAKGRAAGAYALVRGVDGAREVPLEGAEARYSAFQRFVEIQDLKNDRQIWLRMGELLEERDPLLIGTALQQYEKFRRGEPELLLSVRPLLDHPQPEIRAGAARLSGQIMRRSRTEVLPEEEALRGNLVARARRDESVAVRVAATEALDAFEGDRVAVILREIADEDPEQAVRYTAEKMLLIRRQDAGAEAD